MRLVTGKKWEAFADEKSILFPEYRRNRDELIDFVDSLTGEETVVTASLELIDLIAWKFRRGEENVLIYSDTGKILTLKETYELRKYLDFDVRGGFSGEEARTSVLFVEGKTDAKFFKAVFKKLFEFKESREAPYSLRFIERVFERDNFDLLKREEDSYYLAVIPSEGNSGVIRNLGNFLRAMYIFDFRVERIGVAIDIDEDRDAALASIAGKLSGFEHRKTSIGYLVGKTEVVPLIIGLPFEDEVIEWKKPTVEDLMLHLIAREGLLERIKPGLKALNESLGRKLKPKEVMYLALSAYGHWGNLEGFYELFVMRSRFRNLKAVLGEAGLMKGLIYLAGRENGRR
ncbi:DUF3226 domain-containing protein [Thermococcus thioreducens]|uniref:DUF3226 domain-containing protein n=1 Tax=Thermococcus thioreducens TaxID=277988 RepID=A0A0Q2M267_9EURY|nr:DUF3226 domain-containing protein [Thermococcus thioreducens]ASJ11740.1 hypothetical protein A3L14_02030 [Thermococcus thioreducens]KQH81970.1 hypothetical protein AMR53_08505 [Thermococcus thioreducens]SEW14698.1 Protein of unknown function [Thermococcus thioreducens]